MKNQSPVYLRILLIGSWKASCVTLLLFNKALQILDTFRFNRLVKSCLVLILILGGSVGCDYSPRPVVTPLPSSSPVIKAGETEYLVTATATYQPSPTAQATFTSIHPLMPSPTVTSSFTATSISVPGIVVKDMLLLVAEDRGSSYSVDSIWILPSGKSIPQVLLQDQVFSYDLPVWSHDGEWIAFRQRNASDKSSWRLGIIRKNGTNNEVFDKKYDAIGWISWSAGDQALIFDTPSSPFALDVFTGEMTDLWPDSNIYTSETRLMPSPKDNVVAFAEFSNESGTEVKLWLITLVGEKLENIKLPVEIKPQCRSGVTTLEWSPDGTSILTQFRGWPWKECLPQLWLYKLSEKRWFSVVQLPQSNLAYDYNRMGQANWSKDGHWIAWSTVADVLIYSVAENFRIARHFKLSAFESLPASPWLEDRNGNSVFTINRVDSSTYPSLSIDIVGLSPNGSENDDKVLLRIEGDTKWLPQGAIFTPFLWQP